jgi:hypothetical protein
LGIKDIPEFEFAILLVHQILKMPADNELSAKLNRRRERDDALEQVRKTMYTIFMN